MKILSYFSCLLSTSLYFKSHYVNYDEVNRTQLLFIIITSSQATRRAETEAEAGAKAVDNARRRRRRRRRKAPTQKEFVASPDPESNSRHKGARNRGTVVGRVAGVVAVKFGECS